jgi:hypothetical protein
MRRAPAFVLLLLVTGGIVACGGSSGAKSTPSSSDATYQAARTETAQTPASDSLSAYAKQLCQPLKTFLSDAGDTITRLQAQPTASATVSLEDALTQGFQLFGQLKQPLQAFRDSLGSVNPPDDLRSYHQAFLAELDFGLKEIDAVSKNGLAGALLLPTPEATPQSPPGFEAAIVQECGEDIKPFFDEFGGGFFGGNGAGSTPTVAPPGTVGQPVRSGALELLVNSVADPYQSTDEFLQPDAGKRWILIDVSLTNGSDSAQDYGSYDFKLRDTDNFQYDSGFVNQPHDLSSGSLLAGETIRGELGYEVSQNAQLDRLIFEPGFGAEGRIDIVLH